MNNEIVIVKTKEELKKAIEDNAGYIIVKDKKLATNIKRVKVASKATLAIAIGSAGVAATNFWNPVGIASGVVGIASTGGTIAAIIGIGLAMSATLIWALYNNYNVNISGKFTDKDGSEYEGEIILEGKDKK